MTEILKDKNSHIYFGVLWFQNFIFLNAYLETLRNPGTSTKSFKTLF